jgi:hypothetical protein
VSRPKVIDIPEVTEEELTAARLAAERAAKEAKRLKGNQLAVALQDAFALKVLGTSAKK